MITIYWHCLGMAEVDKTFVAGALKELAQHLKEDPKDDPIKLPVSIKALGDEPKLAKEVDRILIRFVNLSYTFSRIAGDISDLFLKFDLITETCSAKLLVYCHPDSDLAKAARREKPLAKWGATCDSSFSAVYKPNNKFTIWHEALHLLGLDECYDENNPDVRRPDCNREDCIMQYEQPDTWVGPFSLCDKNIKLLQELAEKVGR